MRSRIVVGAFVLAAIAVSGVVAGGALKSGPQVGDKYPGPFHPLNVTNCETPGVAGTKNCYV